MLGGNVLKNSVIKLLALLLILLLSGCNSTNTANDQYATAVDPNISTSSIIGQGSSPNSSGDKTTTSRNTVASSGFEASSGNSTSVPEISTSSTTSNEIEVSTPTEESPKSESVETEIKVVANHTPLSESDYFQFSTLTENEKKIYQKLVSAIKSTQNIIEISEFRIAEKDIPKIIERTLADHPEFFWVTKRFAYNCLEDIPISIVLFYTDGTVNDTFGDDLKLSESADRTKIRNQMAEFNAAVNNIISTIPSDASEYDKEKLIFDYLATNLTYDQKSALLNYKGGDVLPRSFDSYGAAVNKLAVCEGYSKLFQYLCYCVGINSTQVVGKATTGGDHMWNAVKVDNVWYQTDATWSRYNNTDLINYMYFHLNADEMYKKNHTVTSDTLIVP